MKLWVMRHGYAGPPSDDPREERERGLTDEGADTVQAVAQAMAAKGEIPNIIFCSPLERAIQTADIVGAELGVQVNWIGDLAPNRPLGDSLVGLAAHNEISRVMVVGHHDNTTPAMNNLGGDVDWDDLVMGEVRRVRFSRKDGHWKMKWQQKPSDIGKKDRTS